MSDPKNTEEYEEYHIEAHPFVHVNGIIRIPKGTRNIEEYIKEHFNDIKFEEPSNWDISYRGADFEVYDKDYEPVEEDYEM